MHCITSPPHSPTPCSCSGTWEADPLMGSHQSERAIVFAQFQHKVEAQIELQQIVNFFSEPNFSLMQQPSPLPSSASVPTSSLPQSSLPDENTIDESIWKTIWRDIVTIGKNVRTVLIPVNWKFNTNEHALRNWDLWGPMVSVRCLSCVGWVACDAMQTCRVDLHAHAGAHSVLGVYESIGCFRGEIRH